MGDEAVLAGVLAALRQAQLPVEPVVLSADPPTTARLYGVASVPRDLASAWRALQGADVLVSGGGSLLQDVTSARSPLYYLAVLEMARRAGLAVVWFAQGIGPLRRPAIRRLVARAAGQARLIVVRDEASRQELLGMGVDPGLVQVAADAVWLLPTPCAPRQPSPEHGLRVGVIWRSWPGRPVDDEAAGRALGRALEGRVRALGRRAEVRVLAMQPRLDKEACHRLARACEEAAGSQGRCHVQVVPAPAEPWRFVELLAGLDGIVSVRLHGLVLAAAAGVPFVGVPWDPKLAAFLREMAWPLPAMAPERLDEPSAWEQALEALASAGAGLHEELAKRCEAMRRRAREGALWLAQVLKEAAEQPGRAAAPRRRVAEPAGGEPVRERMPEHVPECMQEQEQELAQGQGPKRMQEPKKARVGERAPERVQVRVRVLGVPVDAVSLEGAVERLAAHLQRPLPAGSDLQTAVFQTGSPAKSDMQTVVLPTASFAEPDMQMVVTLNPEMVMHARRHPDFAALLQAADLVVADGIGIVWAARLAGCALPGRVPGVELAERLLAVCARRGITVFLLGGRPGVAEQAARRLKQRFVGLVVAGTHHGYFSAGSAGEQALLAQLEQCRPGLLLVGMGAPRQEQWLWRHRARLARCVRVAIGVGGSLDVWAGRVRRAPAIFRRTGTEWLFRLITQPWRARRMAALPRFAAAALLDAMQARSAGRLRAVRPGGRAGPGYGQPGQRRPT